MHNRTSDNEAKDFRSRAANNPLYMGGSHYRAEQGRWREGGDVEETVERRINAREREKERGPVGLIDAVLFFSEAD